MDDIQGIVEGTEVIQDSGGESGGSDSVDEFGRLTKTLEWQPIDFSKLTTPQRNACHELFRRGDISWFLHPEQQKLLDWLDERDRELAVVCTSRQFGKTTMALAYCVAFALTHPKTTTLMLAPIKLQLETYILPRMNLVFSMLPADLVPLRRQTSWTFPNGSILRLEGANMGHGTRIRGDSCSLCVIDECRDIPQLQELIESHISPMFATTNGRLVLVSTPPESPLHAMTDKFIKEAIATDNFYTATYKQNPLLSTKRLRYLMNVQHPGGESNIVFRREYMADYTIADPEKRVVREWDEAANNGFFINYTGPKQLVRAYTSMDYAHSDPCGILVGFLDQHEGCIVIEDEWFEKGMNTDEVGFKIIEMEKKLRDRIPNLHEEFIRICDIDPSLIHDLASRFNLRFEPCHKINSTVAMINRLRVAITEGKIRIRPNCAQTIFQLQAGVYANNGTSYLRTEKGGHLDLIDAAKYWNLNCRWNEILVPDVKRTLKPGEIYVGGFSAARQFHGGGIMRPVR